MFAVVMISWLLDELDHLLHPEMFEEKPSVANRLVAFVIGGGLVVCCVLLLYGLVTGKFADG